MALPSPICLVNGNATPPAIAVTKGSTVTIALENPAGAQYWSISCTSTDETNNAATINATLVVNMGAKTATFTAPNSYGSAMIFTSIVGIDNVGVDANRTVQAALTTTFKVNVLTTLGIPVFAADEELESNASFGWIVLLNSFIRVAPSTLPNGTADQLLDTDHTGNFVEWFTAGGDVTFASHDFTVTGLQVVSLPSITTGVLYCNGAAWLLATLPVSYVTHGSADQLIDTNHAGNASEWFTVGGDLTYASHSFTVAKIQGVTVSGTPAQYNALVATSTSAASWGQINLASSAAVTGQLSLSNLTHGTTAQILIEGASAPTWVTVSQDAIISNTGAITVQGLQTVPISATAPNLGQLMGYNGTDWLPVNQPIPVISTEQIAILKWYAANQLGTTVTVGTIPYDCCFDGENIWVTSSGEVNTLGTVTKFHAVTGTVLATVTVGTTPAGLCFDGTNIWVCNESSGGGGNITKILASTGAIVGTYTVGSNPEACCFDGTYVWVANGGSASVSKVLASSGAVVATVTVGTAPIEICFDGASIWVTSTDSNTVTKIAASSATVTATLTVGSRPQGVCFDGYNIWVCNFVGNSVTKILASTATILATYTVFYNPAQCCFDGTNIWFTLGGASNVVKYNAVTSTFVGTFTVGSAPQGICFDGTNIWVCNEESGGGTAPGNVSKL